MNTKNLAGYGSIVMSLLTALAAAPYSLGEVATIIPPAWKQRVFIAGAIATLILRVIRDNQSVVKNFFNVGNVQSDPPATPKIEG
jgi:4-hydroxybenzoate polyprenyltransferase